MAETFKEANVKAEEETTQPTDKNEQKVDIRRLEHPVIAVYSKGESGNKKHPIEDDDAMAAMNEEDMYRNFGNMQAKQRKHDRIKQKLGKE